jgi:hypothetical protein
MRFSFLSTFVALTALTGVCGGMASSANAAITLFTNQAEFEAALTSSYLNDFTGAGELQVNYTASDPGTGFSYQATQSGAGPNPENTYQVNNLLQTFFSSHNLLFTSTSNNYNAIGGNFFITNVDGNFISQALTVTVTNGIDTLTTPSFTPTNATTGSFRGFISTSPITTLTINNATIQRYASADNLRVGSTLVAAAPEPGTFALLALGTFAGGIVCRRRKA